MINQTDTTEEVTVVETPSPQSVVKKTTRQVVEPAAKGEAPQKVYDKKKTIFRFNQIIWYVLGFIEVMLAFRIVLRALGAAYTGFTSLVYTLTDPLAVPFRGIFQVTITGSSTIEWSTIIAGIVYLCIAWGLVYFLDIIYPITPKDIETQ